MLQNLSFMHWTCSLPIWSGSTRRTPEGYTATDILSRFKRAQGYNVLHPMGWDAPLWLPAEQYAMDTGNDPADHRKHFNFKRQSMRLDFLVTGIVSQVQQIQTTTNDAMDFH